MQPRLTRSSTEKVIAGVSGGLAEYFHIDPVIVRMIFILVTITSGLGLPVYLVLWLVMPQSPARGGPPPIAIGEDQPAAAPWATPNEVRLREPARQYSPRQAAPPTYADQPPPPEAYAFDPLTGERIRRDSPATGATTDLSRDVAGLAAAQGIGEPAPQPAPRRRGRVSWFGVILVTFGVVLLAEQLGIDPDILFPIIMVGAGLMLLLRRR